ncbi:MAG: DUF177 domain-containing protein [Elusimicrobiota bacterium]
MKLNLKKISGNFSEYVLKAKPDSIKFLEEIAFKDDILLTCAIEKQNNTFKIKSLLKACLLLEFAKCLKTFDFNIKEDFTVFAKINKDDVEQKADDLADNDIFYISVYDQVIDFTDRVKDEILLSLPIKPLCKENCKGLCSMCGKDLNLGFCECRDESLEPRWEKLREIKFTR